MVPFLYFFYAHPAGQCRTGFFPAVGALVAWQTPPLSAARAGGFLR